MILLFACVVSAGPPTVEVEKVASFADIAQQIAEHVAKGSVAILPCEAPTCGKDVKTEDGVAAVKVEDTDAAAVDE